MDTGTRRRRKTRGTIHFGTLSPLLAMTMALFHTLSIPMPNKVDSSDRLLSG
jgi:hypothetical protein